MTGFRKWIFTFLFLALLGGLVVPCNVRAEDGDFRAVVIAAGVGVGVGAAAGLVTYPISGDIRNVAYGSALGLVLGIVTGIYHIQHRYDPENPLQDPAPPYEETRSLRSNAPGVLSQTGQFRPIRMTGEIELHWVLTKF